MMGKRLVPKRVTLRLKKPNIWLTLLMAALCSMASLFLDARPALAASVTVSPDSDQVGEIVTVSGTGFTPGTTVRTYFAYDTTYETVKLGIVASDGTVFQFVTVPEMPASLYEVRVVTSYEYASDFFTVEASLELDKASALVGERVTVYGKGFRASRGVNIRFDGDTVDTTATNSRGSFVADFQVPPGERGSHEVSASDNSYSATARISVEQSISLSPQSGPAGTVVTVSGTGFRDNRDVIITFEGDEIETTPPSVSTDSAGSFTASLTVPTCVNESYEISASDGRYVATADFKVLANIDLDPDSGRVGGSVTVTGSGFRSSRTITLTFADVGVVTEPLTVHSDDGGCFELGFDVPVSTSGSHTVKASDGVNSASATFTTTPSISLLPSSGPIGAEVAVTGTGFGANKVVTIRFSEEHVRTSATDAGGSFADSFVVPQDGSGNYQVSASDGVATASGIFTITTSVGLEPNTGHVGTLITVNGTGFSGAVTIQYDGEIVAATTADANGAFSVSFAAPKSEHGHHVVMVADAVNSIETTFTMESQAPPIPELISPENGVRQGSRPSFEWGAVSDPSGVTYSLQVATDSSFGTLVLNKDGLTQSQYTLAREEGLPATDSEAPYYWRVRAVDGASNASDWSSPRSFFVRFLPQWAIYVLIVVISVLASVLISRKMWRKAG
jgi:hypothetical protein